MDVQRKELIHFAQGAKGLDNQSKLKLILVATGVKPATFFPLKINPKNIEEKTLLERHLRAAGLTASTARPRAYEEIISVKGNTVSWKINGSWYGHDVFQDKKHAKAFLQYIGLVKKQKHSQADRIAGKLYGYPKCCIEHYIKEHNPAFLKKKYTHYAYYQHIHRLERAFPLVQHTPCSAKCAATKRMNAKNASVLKKYAPKFWKKFSNTKKYRADVVVDTESEFVFPAKDGHEYVVITLKPIEGRYYLYSHLTKNSIKRGTVLPATITMRYNYADLKLGKPKRTIKNLHHERHFVLP